MEFSDIIDLDIDSSVANTGLLNKHLSNATLGNSQSSSEPVLSSASKKLKPDAPDASSSSRSSNKLTNIMLEGAPSQVMSFQVSSDVKKFMVAKEHDFLEGEAQCFRSFFMFVVFACMYVVAICWTSI